MAENKGNEVHVLCESVNNLQMEAGEIRQEKVNPVINDTQEETIDMEYDDAGFDSLSFDNINDKKRGRETEEVKELLKRVKILEDNSRRLEQRNKMFEGELKEVRGELANAGRNAKEVVAERRPQVEGHDKESEGNKAATPQGQGSNVEGEDQEKRERGVTGPAFNIQMKNWITKTLAEGKPRRLTNAERDREMKEREARKLNVIMSGTKILSDVDKVNKVVQRKLGIWANLRDVKRKKIGDIILKAGLMGAKANNLRERKRFIGCCIQE